MGVISESTNNNFKSSDFVFSKVKRFLSSFDSANLLDEGEFPTYLKEEIRDLGIGAYKEEQAVVKIENYKACLPDDFSVLYAAYKCSPYISSKEIDHPQPAVSVYNDITWEILQTSKDCQIEECGDNIIEKITVRQHIKERSVDMTLSNPTLLRLSPNVNRKKCTDDCQNLLWSSPYEISITDGEIITNFSDDRVYMKYYALPLVNGLPVVPDIEEVEKAVEWYIIYQTLLKLWTNGEAPDLEHKWQMAKGQYDLAHAKAKSLLKLPTFAGMVNYLRRQRSTNKVVFFAQMG